MSSVDIRCKFCARPVVFNSTTRWYACGCIKVREEDVANGIAPSCWVAAAFWKPYDTPPATPTGFGPKQPADDDNCAKCGKPLSFVGLRQTHPPKRDEQGRVICPHCGYVHGAVSQGGNVGLFASTGAIYDQFLARVPFIDDGFWDKHTCTGGAPCMTCDIAKGY